MIYDLDDIIDNIRNDTSVNFLGLTVTIQHVNGIEASLIQLKDWGITPKGYILLESHHRTGKGVTRESFINIESKIDILDFEYKCRTIKKLSPTEGRIFSLKSAKKNYEARVLYIASSRINYEWIYLIEQNVLNTKVIYVLIDDGGGSYLDEYKNALQFEIYEKPNQNIIVSVMRVWARVFYINLLSRKLIDANRLIDNRIFVFGKENGKSIFYRNQRIADYYDEILMRISSDIPNVVKNVFADSIVINTQCLKENSITDGIVDFEIYRNLINRLSSLELNIVLKPHPREENKDKYKKLGCTVYTDTVFSQESIIAGTKIKPICLISIFSSTLLNAKGIFDIPAISLAKIIKKEKGLNRAFRKQLNDFIMQYENIVMFPRNFDEVIDCLNDLLKERNNKEASLE